MTDIQSKDGKHTILVCNVYGPTHYRDKTIFWEDISSLGEDAQGKDSIFIGDFNTTKLQVEKRGGLIVRDPFGEKMENLMADLDLLDPPLKNGKYTWSNKTIDHGHIIARLERFMIRSSFLQKYMLPISIAPPSTKSYHKPISLSLFHSENMGPISLVT